ncbi:MBL fold metallo-hydrolase [Fusibacter ferrireducens]|uniref:MBL fold metallo-hydrolase n=1 Tax=Fusibacter ferrireducens TaxID=2785058 RepID=A0ABR9ZUJ0_9FIRM|nr:MBL fold metallo-hydrolase [Fusibacter ferrireducens]MBF4693631.1 MBL fold metallo-hydrolase [Fusibacter ferrireducens]
MKLKVLVDNNTYIDAYYCGEPAVSYYIEDEGTKLLLDVGYSDLFMKNAEALGLNLGDINAIVISHGHNDHTRGLSPFFEHEAMRKVTVFAHPEAFNEKYFEALAIGSPMSEQELNMKCQLVLSKTPVKVSPNITFLGEIPQLNDFENRKAIGKQIIQGKAMDDYVLDDTALVYKSEAGIYIITGCSHSGICNIIEYAKQVTGDNRVLGVLGGFHLFEADEQVKKTIHYLVQNDVKLLYPCHCTSFIVKAEIHKAIPVQEVGVGLELNW